MINLAYAFKMVHYFGQLQARNFINYGINTEVWKKSPKGFPKK